MTLSIPEILLSKITDFSNVIDVLLENETVQHAQAHMSQLFNINRHT